MKKIDRIIVEIAGKNDVTHDCFLESEKREAVEYYQRMLRYYEHCPDVTVKLIYEAAV